VRYTVHGFEVVRVKVINIEAESQEQAIGKYEALMASERELLLGQSFEPPDTLKPHVTQIEYADETTEYLVDEVDGDNNAYQSAWHNGSTTASMPSGRSG